MNRGLCKDRIGVQFIKIKCMEISSSIFILPLLLYLTKKEMPCILQLSTEGYTWQSDVRGHHC